MATSSITKNFVISGKEQVEMFVNAIEESAKNRPVHIPVAAREITDEAELLEFMERWEMANVGNKLIHPGFRYFDECIDGRACNDKYNNGNPRQQDASNSWI